MGESFSPIVSFAKIKQPLELISNNEVVEFLRSSSFFSVTCGQTLMEGIGIGALDLNCLTCIEFASKADSLARNRHSKSFFHQILTSV